MRRYCSEMSRQLCLIGCLSILLSALPMRFSVADGVLQEITDFGANPGDLKMFVWLPHDLPPDAPLVVALHGCTQMARDFDDETGWTKYAALWRFALLLPEQSPTNNGQRCFNWFRPDDTSRDQGETLSIRHMITAMRERYAINPERIYVTGLSAGGAMTAVLLATYPEVFAGGAIMAGVPYGCASGMWSGFWCMLWGRDLDAIHWGAKVHAATAELSLTRRPAKLSLWQGDNDNWVVEMNQQELLEQWSHVFGIDTEPDRQDRVHGYSHAVYYDGNGKPRLETYRITGMGHGQPIAPGNQEDQCGKLGDYMLAVGICASYHSARFWGLNLP